MQVMPWSAKLKYADGYDHEFLFQGDLDWLLSTYCLVIRQRWPNAIIYSDNHVNNTSKKYVAPRVPRHFHRDGGLLLYRDQEMVAFADEHGNESDTAGESYLTLWIWPNKAGAHLDLVTAEPFAHPFTNWAVGTLVQLIGWWHHVRYTAQNKPYSMPPGHGAVRAGALHFVGVGGHFDGRPAGVGRAAATSRSRGEDDQVDSAPHEER